MARVQGTSWCFTLNNPYDKGYQSTQVLEEMSLSGAVRYASFALEEGENGTPHFQGFVKTFKNCKIGYFKKHFFGGQGHWEPGRKNADDLQRRNYTLKAPLDGPWEYGAVETEQGRRTDLERVMAEATVEDVREKYPETYVKFHSGIDKVFAERKRKCMEREFRLLHKMEIDKIDQLYPWQHDIVYLASTQPDRRSIYWFWEQHGNIGKSTIGDMLICDFDAIILSGKVADMRYSFSQNPSRVVVFDLCRTQSDCLNAFAHFCEELKNGRFMNGKYESKQVLFPRPHIFVFANFEYNGTFFSADRVKCHCVTDYTESLYGNS